MPTHDPTPVQAVARAIEDADASDPSGLATYDDLATAALSAPPVAAAFAALAEVERLHVPYWRDRDGARHHFTVVCATEDLPDGHVCRDLGDWNACHPEWDEHAIEACHECRQADEDGEAGYLFFPCPTVRAIRTALPTPTTEETTHA